MASFIKSTNTHISDWSSPERRLFIAVLSQAIHDAFSNHVPKSEKQQAQFWLTSNSRDFKNICEHVGRNARYVLEKVRKKILRANGWNINISMRTTPPRVRKQKHLTGNAYYAAKREKDSRPNNASQQ